MSTWKQPQNYRSRPVTVLGGGVLGRRIGCVWSSAGYDVRIRDPSAEQRAAAIAYIKEKAPTYAARPTVTQKQTGETLAVEAFEGVQEAVRNAWLVIEAVPEKLGLKIETFAQLATAVPDDCILASNSSSYKSSEMLDGLPTESEGAQVKARILNMHYYMPPGNMIVELMTDGFTAEGIFPFLVERSREAALFPYVARKESTGFIFNRLWAAVKREVLTILAEGVSEPREIDSMWRQMFVEGGALPCEMMDNVGLDTVAFIEDHYIKEHGLSGEKTAGFLREKYLDHGRLGTKSANGGLYPPRNSGQS
ncbi:3-hydroxyacyl-CoA dehydrogenase [Aspergillus sp. HF37]|nr:3-hydroxyacyl-CoA dehydrogenase [Aspergillus sp. HF37]